MIQKGDKFGSWTVKKYGGKFNSHRHWFCVCQCGKGRSVREANLKSGHSTQCRGCSSKGNRNRFSGYKQLSGDYWTTIIKGARQRGIDFDLDIKTAWEKFEEQSCRCALSGVELVMDSLGSRQHTASLDRIDSDKGYTSENIQWVHKELNRMKGALPQEEFVHLCQLVAGNTSS